MSHAGPTRIQLNPDKVAALRELVETRGIAEACRRTHLGRLAIGSILGMHTAPAAQAALLDRAFGLGPAPVAMPPAVLAMRTGGRPF
ncbi:MAG: hypothetical protein ABUL60_32910 [Myxococcales bacterium]